MSGAGVPDPPKQPQCVPRSAHSVVITWEGPVNNGATITDYRLEWQQKAEQDFSQVHKLVQKFTLFLLIWGCRTNWKLKTVMQMWLAGQVDSSQFESLRFFLFNVGCNSFTLLFFRKSRFLNFCFNFEYNALLQISFEILTCSHIQILDGIKNPQKNHITCKACVKEVAIMDYLHFNLICYLKFNFKIVLMKILLFFPFSYIMVQTQTTR